MQRGGNRLDQIINAGAPMPEAKACFGEYRPIRRHQPEQGPRAFFRILPQKVIQARDVMVLCQYRPIGAVEVLGMGAGHHHRGPSADHLGFGCRAITGFFQRAGIGQCACAGLGQMGREVVQNISRIATFGN